MLETTHTIDKAPCASDKYQAFYTKAKELSCLNPSQRNISSYTKQLQAVMMTFEQWFEQVEQESDPKETTPFIAPLLKILRITILTLKDNFKTEKKDDDKAYTQRLNHYIIQIDASFLSLLGCRSFDCLREDDDTKQTPKVEVKTTDLEQALSARNLSYFSLDEQHTQLTAQTSKNPFHQQCIDKAQTYCEPFRHAIDSYACRAFENNMDAISQTLQQDLNTSDDNNDMYQMYLPIYIALLSAHNHLTMLEDSIADSTYKQLNQQMYELFITQPFKKEAFLKKLSSLLTHLSQDDFFNQHYHEKAYQLSLKAFCCFCHFFQAVFPGTHQQGDGTLQMSLNQVNDLLERLDTAPANTNNMTVHYNMLFTALLTTLAAISIYFLLDYASCLPTFVTYFIDQRQNNTETMFLFSKLRF